MPTAGRDGSRELRSAARCPWCGTRGRRPAGPAAAAAGCCPAPGCARRAAPRQPVFRPQGISASLPPGCPVWSRSSASRASASGNVRATGTTRSPPAASATRSARTRSRNAALCGHRAADHAEPVGLRPAGGGDGDDARRGPRTSARETSTASSVPTVSSAAATPPGAAARTRSASPGPYATGVPPKRRTTSKLRSLAVPMTRTPWRRACCSTLTPTAPDAPCSRIVSPPDACVDVEHLGRGGAGQQQVGGLGEVEVRPAWRTRPSRARSAPRRSRRRRGTRARRPRPAPARTRSRCPRRSRSARRRPRSRPAPAARSVAAVQHALVVGRVHARGRAPRS